MKKRPYEDNVQYFHYECPPDAQVRVAHGVWGGVNPYGEIELCFYEESAMPPELTAQEIAPDGSPGPERVMDSDMAGRHVKRNIHTRLVASYDSARAIMAWLDERIAEMETDDSSGIYDGNPGIRQ